VIRQMDFAFGKEKPHTLVRRVGRPAHRAIRAVRLHLFVVDELVFYGLAFIVCT
jgi:hypothetical protein